MKKSIVIFVLLAVSTLAGAQSTAKEVLDKVSATLDADREIRIEFNAQFLQQGQPQGNTRGVIYLKGEKFKFDSHETACWFNGKTLWSYLATSNEVNISNPTREELQSINPYLVLKHYRKNYQYTLGSRKQFQGKAIAEVELTPLETHYDIAAITVCIDRQNYRPVFLEVRHNNGLTGRFTLTDYRTQQSLANSLFEFDPKQYPTAEQIDLR